MKYEDKNSVVFAAQKSGSASKTFSGAKKYLIQNTQSVFRKSYNYPGFNGKKEDFIFNKRSDKIAKGLNLKTLYEFNDFRKNIITEKLSYKRASGSWAGGMHTISINLGKANCNGNSDTVYSSNGKWSGKNSNNNFTIEPSVHENMLVIAGLVTLKAIKIKPNHYLATWAEQGRGFDLKPVNGWIIKGYHVKSTGKNSYETAVKKVSRERAKTLNLRLKTRRSKIDSKNIFVSELDSINAGNCRIGTKNFKNRILAHYGFGDCAIRADLLISFKNDIYIQRAILSGHKIAL